MGFSLPCFGQKEESEIKSVNIYVGFFFMVNFVLGTGFLGLPFTFFHGGLLVGACTLLFIAFMTWQTALYELEAMGRAQEFWDLKNSVTKESQSADAPKYTIKVHRKFEPSELCEVFVGKWLKIVYLIVLALYCFLACLSYSTVTGSAWSVNIPLNFGPFTQCSSSDYLNNYLPGGECRNTYQFCLFLFAVLVVPLSLLNLKEQAIVQFSLGVLRFVTLGAIIVFCLANILMGHVVDVSVKTSNETCPGNDEWINMTSATNVTSMTEIVTRFSFTNWVVGIPVIAYAFILHQGIPGLTHPIKEKLWLRGFFNVLFITTTSFYLVLGVVGALWFRNIVNETVTLNWGPLTHGKHSLALKILSYYIIFFPSIDVCSVYPLVVHTIVNNVYTVAFSRDTSQDKGWKLFIIQLSMKLVAAVLPIAIAMGVSNLVYVLKYAGLVGFFIVLLFPITLQLASQWKCFKHYRYLSVDHSEINGVDTKGLKQHSTSGHDYSVQESTPLLSQRQQSKFSPIQEFFFSFKAQSVSWTPYSTYLSHPLIVVFMSFFTVSLFALTCVSFSHQPKSCSHQPNSTLAKLLTELD